MSLSPETRPGSRGRSPLRQQRNSLSAEEERPCIRSRSPSPMPSVDVPPGCLREELINAKNLAVAQICCGKAIAVCDLVALVISLLNSGHPPTNFTSIGIVGGIAIAALGAAAFHHERRKLRLRHTYKQPVVCGFNLHTHLVASTLNMCLSTVVLALFIMWMVQLGLRIRSHKAAHLKDSDEIMTEFDFATNFIGAMAAMLCLIATMSSLQLVCFSRTGKELLRVQQVREASRQGSIAPV